MGKNKGGVGDMSELEARIDIIRDGDDVLITTTPGVMQDLVMPAVESKLQEIQRAGALDTLQEASFRFDFSRLTLVEE
jgi:hypothetical protein